jgi:hypothetical protein
MMATQQYRHLISWIRGDCNQNDLNVCPKKDIIKEGARPRDVKAQAQVSKEVCEEGVVEDGESESLEFILRIILTIIPTIIPALCTTTHFVTNTRYSLL